MSAFMAFRHHKLYAEYRLSYIADLTPTGGSQISNIIKKNYYKATKMNICPETKNIL